MTTLFDGMAPLLGDVLGGVVMVVPAVGLAFELQAIFRETPVEDLDGEGGGYIDMAAVLAVPATHADLINAEDVVQVSPSRSFRVVNHLPKGSPAHDGEVLFELEEIGS